MQAQATNKMRMWPCVLAFAACSALQMEHVDARSLRSGTRAALCDR